MVFTYGEMGSEEFILVANVFHKKSPVSQPRSFDKHFVLIQYYERNMHARDLCFDRIPFWVQVYDIPIRFLNRVVGLRVPILNPNLLQKI